MKKLKDISIDITEEEYRELDDLSYSLLSSVGRDGHKIAESEFEGNDATRMGNLVEELYFGTYDPLRYKIEERPSISDTLKKCIDAIVSYMDEIPNNIKDFEDESFDILVDNGDKIPFWEKKEPAWRIKKIFDDDGVRAYVDTILVIDGIIKITPEQSIIANHCSNTLKTHQFTKDILAKDDPHIDAMTQFKGRYNVEGTPIKFMMDYVKVDHIEKIIYLYDLKTGSKKVESFRNSYLYWRYDIQETLYFNGAKEILLAEYPGYSVMPMKFVYISTSDPFRPLIYKGSQMYTEVWLGYTFNNLEYKGIKELIDDYNWYLKNSFNVQYPEKVYLSNGVVELNLKGLKINQNAGV